MIFSQHTQIIDIFEGLNSFIEPCYAIYDIHSPDLDRAAAELKATITIPEDIQVVVRCRQKRIDRIKLMNVANRELVCEEFPPGTFTTNPSRSACSWISQGPVRHIGATASLLCAVCGP